MTSASEQCSVCGTVILLTCNKYRLVKATTEAAGAQDHTKVGQTLLNVTKSTAALQLIREGKLISTCCCKDCYKLIMKVDKAEQQLFLLRSELESKIKITCIRHRHTAQNVLLPVQIQSMVGAPRKRVPQSPLAKTGITPPSKRPSLSSSTTRRPLQPSTLQQSSSSTSGTPPSKPPPPLTKRPLQPLAPKPTTLPVVVTPQLRQELFPKRSQVPTTSTAQEEIRIPVYTDLESDADEDIKVVAVNNPHVSRVLPGTIKEIGKALLYRSDIVEAVLKCADLKEKLIEKVMITLSEECKHLCGTKFNSLLRKCSLPQLLEFSMEAVMSE